MTTIIMSKKQKRQREERLRREKDIKNFYETLDLSRGKIPFDQWLGFVTDFIKELDSSDKEKLYAEIIKDDVVHEGLLEVSEKTAYSLERIIGAFMKIGEDLTDLRHRLILQSIVFMNPVKAEGGSLVDGRPLEVVYTHRSPRGEIAETRVMFPRYLMCSKEEVAREMQRVKEFLSYESEPPPTGEDLAG